VDLSPRGTKKPQHQGAATIADRATNVQILSSESDTPYMVFGARELRNRSTCAETPIG
jgi:hypothetical protein